MARTLLNDLVRHSHSRLAPVVVAALLVVALTLSACLAGPSASLTPITVGVPPLEQNALLYVAESQGFFEDNGLHVTVTDYETGLATVNALLAGEVDIAELAEFPFIKPVFEGQPLRIIAVNDRFENDYLLVGTGRGIETSADLKGKRIGVIRGTVLEFYLGRFLELQGLKLEDVVVVDTISPAGTNAAMLNGEVDAVVQFEPHASALRQQLGETVLTWPVQSEQLVYGMLVATEDWLTAKEDAVLRFLKSLAEAEEYIGAHPQEAKDIVQERLGLDSAYHDRTWPLHQFSLSLDLSLIIALNDEARWMMNNGLTAQKTLPDFKEYVYLEGLKAIAPEAVTIVR